MAAASINCVYSLVISLCSNAVVLAGNLKSLHLLHQHSLVALFLVHPHQHLEVDVGADLAVSLRARLARAGGLVFVGVVERGDFVDVDGVLGRVDHLAAPPANGQNVLAEGLALHLLASLVDALAAMHCGFLRVAEGAVALREVTAYRLGHSIIISNKLSTIINSYLETQSEDHLHSEIAMTDVGIMTGDHSARR